MGLKGSLRRKFKEKMEQRAADREEDKKNKIAYRATYREAYAKERIKSAAVKARSDARRRAAHGSRFQGASGKAMAVGDYMFGIPKKKGRTSFDPWTGFSSPKAKTRKRRKKKGTSRGKTITINLQ